jgi:hypothetical protein
MARAVRQCGQPRSAYQLSGERRPEIVHNPAARSLRVKKLPRERLWFVRKTIRRALKTFKWHHWLVAAAFISVLGFTGLHAYRAVRDAIYWSYNRDEPIQGWMNVGFVSHSYHVPPHVLFKALGLPLKPPDKRPLRDIANAQNHSLDELRAILQDAIVHARPPYPPPPPPPPPEEEGKP